jgi:hypothetical protein
MRYRWRTAVVAAAVIAALLGADPVQAGSVAGPSTGQPGPGRIQGNLDAVYTVNMSATDRNGTWRLRVRDAYRGNTGYLGSWTLNL